MSDVSHIVIANGRVSTEHKQSFTTSILVRTPHCLCFAFAILGALCVSATGWQYVLKNTYCLPPPVESKIVNFLIL